MLRVPPSLPRRDVSRVGTYCLHDSAGQAGDHRGGCGEASDGSDVVPGVPALVEAAPLGGCRRAVGVDLVKVFVEGDVAAHRHADDPAQVDDGAGEAEPARGAVALEQGDYGDGEAEEGGA